MDIITLQTFLAVIEEGGILAASKVLHTVQSNVTSRIQRLEDELDTALFFRQGRTLILTPAGRILQDYATRITALERQARQAVQQWDEDSGEVRIGTMESFAAIRLPQVLLNLRQHSPHVEVTVQTGTSADLVNRVLRHELDCAFIGGPFEHPDLISQTVAEEELVLVRATQNPNTERLILFREGCAYRDRANQWLARQRMSFEVMEMGTLDGILGCVAFGLGQTLMPKAVYDKSPYRAQLQYQRIEQDIALIPTLLIHHRQLQRLPGLSVLQSQLVAQAA